MWRCQPDTMRVKLDENLGTRTQGQFRDAGHDVQSVLEEELGGATDADIFQVCQAEGRCLVTLDLDFSNVVIYPPERSAGIVVLRLSRNPSLNLLQVLVAQFLEAVEHTPVNGQTWIVEANRIRIHQQPDTDA
jgi:predicted nuclease of predicted toxin-antitoxin system